MATTTTITKLLFRRGNDADRKKTILASGEPGFALDTGRFFIGDGSTPGGHPIVQTGPWHINYIDEIGTVDGDYSRQFLDISVPGLSATLAGDAATKESHPDFLRDIPKLFHPTDRTLLSDYKLQLTGLNDPATIPGDNGWPLTNGGASIEFSGNSQKTFTISRSPDTPGKINIGDMIFMDTESKTLYFETDTFSVEAENQLFGGGNNTLFEDGSIDLNVPLQTVTEEDGLLSFVHNPTDAEATIASAEGVGLHFAQHGYLSAGGIFIKDGPKETSTWNTMILQAPTWHHDWMDGYSNLIDRIKGKISVDGKGDPIHTMPGVARFFQDVNGTTVRSELAPIQGSKSEGFYYAGQSGPYNWETVGNTGDKYNNMASPPGSTGSNYYTNAKPIELRNVRPAGRLETGGVPSDRITYHANGSTTGTYGTIYAKSKAPSLNQPLHKTATYPGITVTDRGALTDDPWAGPVHLVFETGLIVYGPGDRDIQSSSSGGADGLNGYLINQSLDSYAVPTFQGMNIEGPNSKPMQVDSGGTSRREHVGGWLITGGGSKNHNTSFDVPASERTQDSDQPVNHLGLIDKTSANSAGVFLGTSTGAVVSGDMTMLPAGWWSMELNSQYTVDNNNKAGGSGNLKFENRFCPKTLTVGANWDTLNASYDKRMFFDKWTYIKGDSGDAEPSRFDAGIHYQGDVYNMITAVEANTTPVTNQPRPANATFRWDSGDGPISKLKLTHVNHASATGGNSIWNKANSKQTDTAWIRAGADRSVNDGGSGNTYTKESGGNGYVISRVDFNKGGHVREVHFKDFDHRYPQLFHMGTNSRRNTVIKSPGGNSGTYTFDVTPVNSGAISGQLTKKGSGWSKAWLESGSTRFGSGLGGAVNVNVPKNIFFNDYGTINSFATQNLNATFYNKVEIANLVDNLAYDFEEHEVRLDNDFLRRNASSATTSSITTDWTGKSRIRFSEGGTIRTQMWQNNSQDFHISGTGDIFIDCGGGSNDDVAIRYGSKYSAIFNTAAHLYYNNSKLFSTTSYGAQLHGSSDPRTGSGPGKYLNGTCQWSNYASNVWITERETNAWHSVTFTSDNAENSGYETLCKDNVLRYNCGTNTLWAQYYTGDGRHLDMSKNTTIPPTVELQTSGNAYYRVVGCTSDRHKIYDRDNTVKFHGTAGHILAKGDIIAYYSFSDRRLKEKITTLNPQESLNKVLALESVSFEWKHSPERGEQIGLIAQQVEEVVPQVVHEADRYSDNDQETKYKRVEYDKIVPLLVDSIKVLTARVEELEAKLEAK